MTTTIAVIQKGMDESNARFDRMFKELAAHESGTDLMLKDFELKALAELEKAEQDRNTTASGVLAELASMKQDDFDAWTAATNVNINIEDEIPSHECGDSAPLGLNPDGKPKLLLHFISIDKPMSTSSTWKWEIVS